MPFLSAVATQIGTTGCIVLALLAFYEGVPGLRDIPFVDRVPVARELLAGRVASERARAADEARRGYVAIAEKAALEARLAEQLRQRNAAAQSLEEHRKRLAAAELAENALSERLEQEIATHEAELDRAGRACRLDDADVDWLRRPT